MRTDPRESIRANLRIVGLQIAGPLRRRPGSSTQRNHWEKKSKIGLDVGPESGVDLDVLGQGKNGWKIRRFRDRIRDRLRAAKKKLRDRIRDVKTTIPGELPPYFPLRFLIPVLGSELSDWKTSENALSAQRNGRTNKYFGAKKIRKWASAPVQL